MSSCVRFNALLNLSLVLSASLLGACGEGGSKKPVAVVADAATFCTGPNDCADSTCDRVSGRCVECTASSQCPIDRPSCTGGVCEQPAACATTRDCSGRACDVRRGLCLPCLADADCDQGERCRLSVCSRDFVACDRDGDCATGLHCDAARHACVACRDNADCSEPTPMCGAGWICQADQCDESDTSWTCIDSKHISHCERGRIVSEACAGGTSCQAGACRPQVCVPDAHECVSPEGERVCSADGLEWKEQACPTGQGCEDQACAAQICEPNAAVCADVGARSLCSPSGVTTRLEACGSEQSCKQGTCFMRVCDPNTSECSDETHAVVCQPDGLKWNPSVCAQPCANGRCGEWACAPGETTCADDTHSLLCSANGKETTVVACPADQHCLEGACRARLCEPKSTQCDSQGRLLTCQADGLAFATEACAERNRCRDGACKQVLLTEPTMLLPSVSEFDTFDLDRDGLPDLTVVANDSAAVHTRSGGPLAQVWLQPDPGACTHAGWVDLQGKGDKSLVVTHCDAGPNALYPNQGDGTLALKSNWTPAMAWSGSPAFGDWDQDGDEDVFIPTLANLGSGVPSGIYLSEAGVLATTPVWVDPDKRRLTTVVWRDFNADGRDDVLFGTNSPPGFFLYQRTTDPQLPLNLIWSRVDVTTSEWLSAGRIGGALADKLPVPSLSLASSFEIHQNNAGTIAATSSFVLSGGKPGASAWADWDRDGDTDLALGMVDPPAIRVYQASGSSLATDYPLVYERSTTQAVTDLAWVDWDGDGYLDLLFGGGGAPLQVIYTR